ncbi:MAG TPA: hypothetical protein VK838_03480 [Candidatus Limnocylindrales bacterium]|nr:hypothetical protein [Candidatus Limnocylindrales bacterium]
MAGQLEIAAHGVTAILATWLGLTVMVRARRLPAARIFGLMALFLVLWSVAIIVERISDVEIAKRVANGFEDVGAFGVIAATPHIAVAISSEGRWTSLQRVIVSAGYVLAGLMALPSIINPEAKLSITPPHFELPGIPGEVFGWAWIAARVVMFGLALTWLTLALRRADGDIARRRQLQVALLTVGLGVVGGVVRFTPPLSDTDPWLGVSFVTLAMLAAAYAVFAQGLFFPFEVAVRTFRYSVAAGLAVTLYVGVVVGLDGAAERALGIELPIVTGLALAATIALIEPVSQAARSWFAGRSGHAAAYERLLSAMGDSLLLSQGPHRSPQQALARLTRGFRLTGATVQDTAGRRIASHGTFEDDNPLTLRLPLISDGREFGTVTFGPKRSGLPFATDEVELLKLAARYLAETQALAESEQAQAVALDRLSGERRRMATAGSELQAALAGGSPRVDAGLYVFALGPLRVERGGELVRQWGGAKAGTRQAEAVFAFLLDRGERGVAKDEILELIWPDVEMERADLAFHRTLGGLRRTLEPGRRGGDRGGAITFHNDRYRLDPSIAAWSDVEAFDGEIAAAGAARDLEVAIQHLERARSLYRGEFLDDCPFYGDSSQVEDRRELLRGRYVDLLLELGSRYEARGDRPAAASSFRQARVANGQSLPPADEALTRLGVAT